MKKKEYTKQHWLPVGYMKFFTRDGEHFFRYDKKIQNIEVRAKDQCYGKWFYSHTDPKNSEEKYQPMENNFPILTRKVLETIPLQKNEKFGMIYTMIMIHLRNAAYENRTKQELTDVIDKVMTDFFSYEISDLNTVPVGIDKVLKGLIENWELDIITSNKEAFFVSDHPSLFISIDGKIKIVFLPINSLHLLVAYDKFNIEIISKIATYNDVSVMNTLQANQAVKAIFAEEKFSQSDLKILQKILSKKPRPNRGFFNIKSSRLEYINLNKELQSNISFLKTKE